MRVTASKYGLLEHCQRWARDDIEWRHTTSSAADRGNRFHSAIAAFVETGELKTYEDDIAGEMTAAIAWLHTKGWSRDEMIVERAFGWEPETDTAVDYDVAHRGYPKDGRLHGTADLLVIRGPEDVVEVWDYKTGDGSGAGPQLRALGLMVARRFDLDEVRVGALEVKASGVTELCVETLDAFALSALAGEAAELLALVADAEPQPSFACRDLYCPAVLSCEAGTKAVDDLYDVEATALTRAKPFKLTDPIRTPEHAAWALDVIRLMNAKLDAIKDDIKARVPADGWRLEDGRVLRESKSTVSYADKDMLASLARRLGATDEDLESCMRSFDKSSGLRVVGGKTTRQRRRKHEAA